MLVETFFIQIYIYELWRNGAIGYQYNRTFFLTQVPLSISGENIIFCLAKINTYSCIDLKASTFITGAAAAAYTIINIEL